MFVLINASLEKEGLEMLKKKLIFFIAIALLLAQSSVLAAEEQRSTNNLGYVFGAKEAAKAVTVKFKVPGMT